MTKDEKVEWQVRIIAGAMMLVGIALFAAFVLWGLPLLKAIVDRVFTAEFWSEAYWVVLIALLLWVIWQNYLTRLTREEWAKALDNQYNLLKEDLEEIKRKVW